VKAGTTSLLRLFPIASGLLGPLMLASLAITVPAVAASPAPDPSPSGGSAQPDPYLASPKAPARVYVPSGPARTLAPATQVHTAPAVRPKHKPRGAVTRARTMIRIRRPDNPAPSIVQRLVSAADPGRHISTGLALAVAGLVLLSGALVAGAAREVAR